VTVLHAFAVAACLVAPLAGRAGEVKGVIRFLGHAPPAAAIPTSADKGTCGEAVPDESLLVAEGGVENVVVRVEVPGATAAPRTLTLDQRRCRYVPRVQVAAPGSTLELANGDPILHNVHGYLGPATAFNVPMPFQGAKAPRTLSRAGVVRVGCDVHAWMSASIVVTPTPYVAVTGPGGRFAIPGVPPGQWQAVAWHERLGEKRAIVTVGERGDATLELAFP
jgi:plastocyanin